MATSAFIFEHKSSFLNSRSCWPLLVEFTMSEASLQLLLHAGELEHIVRTIKASQSAQFAAGCLFGLWRNSLIQPVIQFVTGCQTTTKKGQPVSIEEVIGKEYTGRNADILKQDHCLLHLGFWVYGSQELINRGNIFLLFVTERKCSNAVRLLLQLLCHILRLHGCHMDDNIQRSFVVCIHV